MNSQVERSLNRIADEARDRYQALVGSARTRTERAAGSVRKGKKPVQTLSKFGVNVTGISHRTTAKVLKQQSKMVEHQIDAFASRLRTAAQASSLSDLVRGQLRLIPENTALFASDARAALGIVANGGSEMRDLVSGTWAEFRREAPTAASVKKTAKRAKKKAKSTAKSVKKAAKSTVEKAKAA